MFTAVLMLVGAATLEGAQPLLVAERQPVVMQAYGSVAYAPDDANWGEEVWAPLTLALLSAAYASVWLANRSAPVVCR